MSGINNSVATKNILTAISNMGNGGSNAAAAKNATGSATSKSNNSTNNTHMVGNSGKSQDLTAGASQRTSAQVENTSSSTLDQAAPDIANRINDHVMPSDMNALSNDISNLNAALQNGGGISSEQLSSINDKVNQLQDIVQSVLPEIPSQSELEQVIRSGSLSPEIAEEVINHIQANKEVAQELQTIASKAEFKKKYNNLNATIADLLEQSKQDGNQSQLKSHAGNQNKTVSGGQVVKPQSILSFTEADNLASNMNLGSQVAVMLSMFTSINEATQSIATAQSLSQLQLSLAQLVENVVGMVTQFSSDLTYAYNSYVGQASALNNFSVQNMTLVSSANNAIQSYTSCSPGNPGWGSVFPEANPSGSTGSGATYFWGSGGSLANPAFLYYLCQNSLVCSPTTNRATSASAIIQPTDPSFNGSNYSVQSYLEYNNWDSAASPPFSDNNCAAINGSQIYFVVGCGIGNTPGLSQNMINLPPSLFNMLPPECVMGVSGSSTPQPLWSLCNSTRQAGSSGEVDTLAYNQSTVAPGSVAYVSLPQFMELCNTVFSAVSIITPVTSVQSLISNVFGQSASINSINNTMNPLEQAAQSISSQNNTYLQFAQQTTQNLSNQLQLVQTIIQNFRVQSSG